MNKQKENGIFLELNTDLLLIILLVCVAVILVLLILFLVRRKQKVEYYFLEDDDNRGRREKKKEVEQLGGENDGSTRVLFEGQDTSGYGDISRPRSQGTGAGSWAEVTLTGLGRGGRVVRFTVSENPVTLGRSGKRSQIVVSSDPSISGLHCEMMMRGGTLMVRDRASLNGTKVDGRAVDAFTPVSDGSILKLGDCSFKAEVS